MDLICKGPKPSPQLQTMFFTIPIMAYIKPYHESRRGGINVVMQADKGKMLVVVDIDVYQLMVEDHVNPADSIEPEQLRMSERHLSAQAKALANTLGVGRLQSERNFIRCFDNVASSAEDAATLKLLPKTHKPLKPQGHPQSRPVVTAASGMSSRVGDLVSKFLDLWCTSLSRGSRTSQLRRSSLS